MGNFYLTEVRTVPRICKLEGFLFFSLLVWLIDLAQLPDPSSILPLLQHGSFTWAEKSVPSWALRAAAFLSKCPTALVSHRFHVLQVNT